MDKQRPQGNSLTIDVTGQNGGLCKTGVPFPVGRVTSIDQLKLLQNKIEVDCFARPLCFWHDGSIKWINIGFFHSLQNPAQYELTISDATDSPRSAISPAGIKIEESKDELVISTSETHFYLSLKNLSLKAKSNPKETELLNIPSLAGELLLHNQEAGAKLIRWNSRVSQSLINSSNNALELEIEGCFEYKTNKHNLHFTTILEFYNSNSFVKIQTTLHNPNPAQHPNGRWDLGDEGSELFKAFNFNIDLTSSEKITYQSDQNSEWQVATPSTTIIQHASGGINWQSPVHVNKDNHVELNQNGFVISSDSIKLAVGDRATPIVHSTNGVGVTVEKFWQNFPTSIEMNNSRISVGLFPLITNNYYELQGGEKKTHTLWLDFRNHLDSLYWVHSPATTKPDSAWLARCNALPWFLDTTEADPIENLIRCGLEHKQNFFAKRETIDEYGWRNFGDLYADHEALGYKGNELFVSHYNNQYDPIYGFLRQFLLTGNARWFELADDLARHVKDIDIYHTTGDKAEYNGGLFWHTDHYLKAYTSTHRSYSKLHESNAYQDYAGGGGPGGQHCYTTGLTYHHLLTGAEDSKLAVFTLTKWITHVYEGTGTCLELLLAVKKRNELGLKNHISGQYPFDRGTANYVIALLDSYQLTQDQKYILQVEHIIRNTVHPSDNITIRNLADVEYSWFYTVFLQAICRYLQVKEKEEALDSSFYYARDSLLHYADWMLLHEYPYLDKPEILEFPNDAWTAQEPRKTHILAAAFYYSPENKQEYLDKALYFQEYVVTRLSASPELSYSRVLVLLMQNHGALEYYASQQKTAAFSERRQHWPKANYQQRSSFVISLTKAFFKRILRLSITKEINWLKTRIVK